MSSIEVTIENATAEIVPVAASTHGDGTFLHYQPRDLMDATAAVLLAINTPQSVAWAHAMYELTSGQKA